MRSTFPAVVALTVLGLTLANWPGVSHSVPRAAAAADNPGQSSLSTGKKDQPAPVTLNTPDELRARIESMLNNGVINLDLTGQPLNEVMDFVQSNFPKLQYCFDNAALKDAGIDPATTLVTIKMNDVRLETALQMILHQFNMDYNIRDGLVIISTKQKLDSTLEIRIYDCREILSADSERFRRYPNDSSAGASEGKEHSPVKDLIEVVTNSIGPQSWNAQGGPGSVYEYSGLLIVNQTREVHTELADFLEKLSAKLAAYEKK